MLAGLAAFLAGFMSALSHGVPQPPAPQPVWVEPAIFFGLLGVCAGGASALFCLGVRLERRFREKRNDPAR